MNTGLAVFRRFLAGIDAADPDLAKLTSLALLFSCADGGEAYSSWGPQIERSHLDIPFLERLLEYANVDELPTILWSPIGLALSSECFESLFGRAVAMFPTDQERLWQLGGAANDYLHHHPDAFSPPTTLGTELLDSADVDARIVGLKVLVWTDASSATKLQAIVDALASPEESERRGGLYQLGRWLTQYGDDPAHNEYHGLLQPLRAALLKMATDDQDEDVRRTARVRFEIINGAPLKDAN